MAESTTPTEAPNYSLHRTVKAADALPISAGRSGLNMGGFTEAHIQVVPSGGANPAIAVLFWSAGASAFIPASPPIAFAGAGVDAPYEATIPVRGRKMIVVVTGGLGAGQAKIYVSGFRPS